MPAGPAAKKPASPADAVASDPFAALPDTLLQQVLSFLPAQPAVRTCVLAQRWRRLWEGAPGLRITAANAPEPPCVPDDLVSLGELRELVDHLLLLRGGAPLDTVEFMFDVRDDANMAHVNLWNRHVIWCQLRWLVLTITRENDARGIHFHVDNLPLVSRHLRLELYDTGLNDSFLDFSGFPGLEDLYINNGNFVRAKRILSKSVTRLSVIDCCFNERFRTRINFPSVISLQLEDPWDRTPVLGSMPSLVAAFVRLGNGSIMSLDYCYTSVSGDCGNERCEGCYGLEGDNANDGTANATRKNKSVLLNGLSEAKSLVLTDESRKFIFKRDVKWCPMFRKLKTLLLNEYWCVSPDFCELTCLLEHSPVLEKLTLQICSKGPEHKVNINASYSPVEGSAAISENLKIVEIKCEAIDEGVVKVLEFLETLSIDFNYEELEEILVNDGSNTS